MKYSLVAKTKLPLNGEVPVTAKIPHSHLSQLHLQPLPSSSAVSSLNSTAILALPTLEAFTMLNYWRTTGGGAATSFTGKSRPTTNNTFVSAPAAIPFSDYGFDGPFFDLEFTRRSDEEIELNLDQHFNISPFEEHTKLPPSSPKFRLLLPKLKKPNGVVEKSDKFVRVKFKVDQVKGPLISLFARDISTTSPANQVLQRYLNILKPLSIRVEKMRFHGGGGDADSPPSPGARSNNLQAGIEVVRKHFGKSRPSSAAASVSPPGSNRRDDSLLDGIEGAILHCKRSFNSDRN